MRFYHCTADICVLLIRQLLLKAWQRNHIIQEVVKRQSPDDISSPACCGPHGCMVTPSPAPGVCCEGGRRLLAHCKMQSASEPRDCVIDASGPVWWWWKLGWYLFIVYQYLTAGVFTSRFVWLPVFLANIFHVVFDYVSGHFLLSGYVKLTLVQ